MVGNAESVSGLASDPDNIVSSVWQDQALWSAVATRIGDSIRFWRGVAAIAGLSGLFLATCAGTLSQGIVRDGMIMLGVVLLAVVPYLRQKLVSPERIQTWTAARNVSEQLKEAIYRHLMGALPVDSDGSPANLIRRCRAIKQTVASLAGLAAVMQPPQRKRKTQMTLEEYLSERVDGQIAYYRKKGEQAGKTARSLQRVEFMLALAAVVLGALTGSIGPEVVAVAGEFRSINSLLPLLAVVGAAAAAVTGHIAGAREAETAAKCYASYDLLKMIRDEWRVSTNPTDPDNLRRMVDAVESAISAEYKDWVADWNRVQQGVLQVK